jgi:hypothetical protein
MPMSWLGGGGRAFVGGPSLRSKGGAFDFFLSIPELGLPAGRPILQPSSSELPDKRGFQIGDPQKSTRVDLKLFDFGGHHVEIICATTKDSIRLAQPELNRILKRFHAVLSESAAGAQY